MRLSLAAGATLAQVLHQLRSYEGEAHRCQLVSIINDVQYIDDSKGTNVGATVAALKGLGEGRKRIILLAGGDGKGQDFSPLAAVCATNVKTLIVFGRDGCLIAQAVGQACAIQTAASLEDAVSQAAQLAATGDCVLLSPACASWDMFKGYAHRAEVFVNCVKNLALDSGVML